MRSSTRLAIALTLVGPLGCAPKPVAPVVPTKTAPVAPRKFDAASLPTVRFVDVTEAAGVGFRHANGARGNKLLPETMGSGVAFLDYDGDGDMDLFLVNSREWDDATPGKATTHALYRNDGAGHFEDVTVLAGLDRSSFGMGVAVGDVDANGHPDLYVTGLGGNALYLNEGNGHFADATERWQAGGGPGWSTSATFFDMENDGDLDLFVCGYVAWSPAIDASISTQLLGTDKGKAYDPPASFNGSQCILLRNDGDRFADVSETCGIHVKSPDKQAPIAKSLGVAPLDVDGDGRVDLAVANDTVVNFFFHNLGGGKFEEIGFQSGIAFDQSGSTRAAMGIDWADFKNDGSLGLAIGNFANEMTTLYVTDKPERLLFFDLANLYGLGAPTQPPLKFGLFFFDYDLDGRLDLLTANGHLESDIGLTQASETYAQAAQLFWNTGVVGRELFVLVGPDKAGPDLFRPIVGRGSAFADIDGDGDLDVILTNNGGPPHLFRNEGGNANHWLRIKLVGRGKNRDALGAKVRVQAGGVTNRRQQFTTRGYLSASEPILTFGLGKLTRADEVVITWPSGAETRLTDQASNRVVTVAEPEGPPRP